MLDRLILTGILLPLVLAPVACAPPETPVVEEEEEAPPPPPPPTVYDLGEVDIVAEEPQFTSKNVSFGGVQIGDITNDMAEVLGEQVGNTQVTDQWYISAYRNGNLLIYTFPSTGEIRGIEIVTPQASEVASPAIRAWLEEGNVDEMSELMGGPPPATEENFDILVTGATEYAYDARGIRFIEYDEPTTAIRFTYIP